MDADLTGEDAPTSQTFYYFPTAVAVDERPEFLADMSAVCAEALDKRREEEPELNEIYPVHMTGDLLGDPRTAPFAEHVAQAAWQFLCDQGYNGDFFRTTFSEMWCQEHHKHSAMEQHVHGNGAQVVGFYFLDCPPDSSRPLFHDPKPGKVQIGLPERDPTVATYASNIVNFEPKPGGVILTNSWLPHSFTRHASDEPVRFVHFNLSVVGVPQTCPTPCQPAPEIV